MIDRIKRKILDKILASLRLAVRQEIERALPLISQIAEFQHSPKEDRQSFYDHYMNPSESAGFYEDLKDRLTCAGVSVESVDIDVSDFERWLNNFPETKRHYENMGDVFVEKCLEHYLTFKYLDISADDVYIDIASAGSPWAGILNARLGTRAYRLDLSYPEGVDGIDIGADAGDTKLQDGFASVLSLQCAYECFMGDADILFIEEANRILNYKGRYAIVPLYLADIHYVSTSPYCNQAEVVVEPEAKRVWRDDKFKVPFSRHYSPESFTERIYSRIPENMKGKMLHFNNLDDISQHYTGQRIYCYFMFVCRKRDNKKPLN